MVRVFRSILLAVSLAAWCGVAFTADAPTQPVNINIDEPALYKALIQFSQQAGLNLIFQEPEKVGDLRAPRLSGTYTPQAALEKLLKDSGFTYEFIGPQAVAVRAKFSETDPAKPTASASESDASAVRLAQADPSLSSSEERDSAASASAAQGEGRNASQTATGEGKLEEIVVTAEKREESIQNMPIAISAYSGEDLANQGITRLEELSQLAPSLQTGMRENSYNRVSIRGIGSELGGLADEPGVAVSQNGVPYSSLYMFETDFLDVARVEVLRGPQGTISGRNATAGAINIITNRPTDAFEGTIKLTAGNYGRFATEGVLSGPIAGDRFLGRLALRTDRADGWVKNTLLNEELGTVDKIQVRGSLSAYISDNLQVDLIGEHTRDSSHYLFSALVGRVRPDVPSGLETLGVAGFDWDNRTLAQDAPSDYHFERNQLAVVSTLDLGPSAKVTSTTGYVDLKYSLWVDGDFISEPIVATDPQGPIQVGVEQFSQEFALAADLTNRLDLIVGGLYLNNDIKQTADLVLPQAGFCVCLDGGTQLDSWGAYSQLRYKMTDALRVTAGVRYTHDSKSYFDHTVLLAPPRSISGKNSWSALTPRLSIDYQPSEELTVYSTISRGFKSGGFFPYALPVNSFDPEYVWNYEAGIKANLFDSRLRTSLTGFYMDYKDLQQSQYGLEPLLVQRIVNASSATIKGLELELDVLVSEQFELRASGTWLDATYDEFRSGDPLYPELGEPGPAGVNVRSAAGNRLVRAPEWQFQINGEYTIPLSDSWEGILRASYAWQGKIFFDYFNHPLVSQDAYGLVNLAAAIQTRDERWQLTGFVNNLTDEFYTTVIIPFTVGSPSASAHIGLPRMYGVSLAHRF